ncbi:aspartyl protease family protein [Sphingomonas sp.]|uniref:aspartyl protease family protein n=1 Tax=Sphingomonas sp. TaxID=28214 RepID=UPI001EB76BF2|nr:aspartyl protease family protein [Sphingomonas sp.]MBX3593186.1 aspartyl protease family protein [Sphingomonas sp.]
MGFHRRMMLIAALFAASLPASQLRAAPPVMALAPDSEARWVPFELSATNQIRFRTMVNGRWAEAVLDTGVSDSALSAGFARRLGLKPLVEGRADAIGGSITLAWTGIDRIEVGGMVRTGGRIAIIDGDARATGERPVDLFVGADLLAANALEIDYDAQRFRLIPSGRMPFRGVTLPLARTDRSGLYLSRIVLGDITTPMIVDTGDGSMVTLTQTASRRLDARIGPRTTAIAYGLGGAVEGEIGVLPSLRLAALTLREVELRIEPDAGFSGRKGAGGRIGNGLLRRHRVLLDPGAGRMVLAPGARADWPVARSTSGLMLAAAGERLRVLHVMRGSPAADDGWRVGTEICAVDGNPVSASRYAGAVSGWTSGAPGRTVRLSLCGGGERDLTLRRFY